jgi:hypothetical protein
MAKLGEGERQVRLGQDRLAIKRKVNILFYPHPLRKSKFWYSNNCLHFYKHTAPLCSEVMLIFDLTQGLCVCYDLYGAGAYKLHGIMHSTATAAINYKA